MDSQMALPLCAYCGRPADGNFTIHRDGYGVGPEVDLCDWCGMYPAPSCEEMWDLIAQPSDADGAHYRMEDGDGAYPKAGQR